ncbi:MAG: phosphoribosylglycinamide formyltransferase [Phycisphaerales bacterium]
MPPADPARLACFVSGGGRTVLNLLETIRRGELDARIALVVADRDCPGIQRCAEAGLTVLRARPRDAHELGRLLEAHGIDLVVLAGYLRLLPVPPAWRGRVLNIHPALLPRHGGPGMFGDRVHAAVLAAGDAESGCTVHVCDDRYDTGPIVLQRRVPVLDTDSVETLAARVFEQECIAYPEAIRAVLAERRG